MGAYDLEQAADEAFGRPVGHADAAAGAHHAQHLARGAGMVGREHHAEGRQRDVKAAGLVGQGFRVGDLEAHGQAFGGGAGAAFVQQGLHIVGRGHFGKAARRGQRGVSVACGDVDHTFA